MREWVELPLHRVAHARAGDKGDILNVALFCYDPAVFAHVVEQVDEARVAQAFAAHRPSRVRRFLLPRLSACNFVLDDLLAGGVNNSLRLDRHGKGLAYLLLAQTLRLPPALARAAHDADPRQ